MMTTTAVERNDEGRRWTYSDLCVGDALIGHDLSVSHLRRVHAWLILGRTEARSDRTRSSRDDRVQRSIHLGR